MRVLPIRQLTLVFFVIFSLVLSSHPVTATDDHPTSASPAVVALWLQLDGRFHYQTRASSWLLGPAIRARATEPYAEAPGGMRSVYYFDKARLEVANPASTNLQDLTLGLLVRDMILGLIQVGDQRFIPVAPARIPLAGDLEGNEAAPTYASLHNLVTLGPESIARRAPERIGKPVTELLLADGTVEPIEPPHDDLIIGAYESQNGHTIPTVFWEWLQKQPLPWLTLTGYPISEPYWILTRVAGNERLVLIQAFERRVLTFDPQNPPDWQVEWGNVGLHYRVWRGMVGPIAAENRALAENLPYGDLIVRAARAHQLDPYLLAALAAMTSQFDPLAKSSTGYGLLLVPDFTHPYPFDPTENCQAGAQRLATLLAHYGVVEGLARYLAAAGSSAQPSDVLQQADLFRQNFSPPRSLPDEPALREVGRGQAAYYDPSYSVNWWERTLQLYQSWGQAVAEARPDPDGYYCVHPDYRPGQRLLLLANGVALWCTIGDMVAPGHVTQWRRRWVIELSWPTFLALKLDRRNEVIVWGP